MNTDAGILDRTNLESVVHSATPAVIIRMTGNKYALKNDLSSSVPVVAVTVDVVVAVTSVVLLSISMSQGGSVVVAERVLAVAGIGLGKEMGKEKKRGKAKGKIKEIGQLKGKKTS